MSNVGIAKDSKVIPKHVDATRPAVITTHTCNMHIQCSSFKYEKDVPKNEHILRIKEVSYVNSAYKMRALSEHPKANMNEMNKCSQRIFA